MNWNKPIMDSKTSIKDLFLANGLEIAVPPYHRLIAEENAFVWFLEEGDADLFIIELEEETPMANVFLTTPFPPESLNGSLTYLGHCLPGTCLFPFPFDPKRRVHLLIRANSSCRFRKLPKNVFEKSPQGFQETQAWMSYFAYLTPLLKIPEKMEDTFFADVLSAYEDKKAADSQMEKLKNLYVRQLSENSLNYAFEELQSILDLKQNIYKEDKPDPLFMACQIVAYFLHIPFKPSKIYSQALDPQDYIIQICTDAGVQYREIKLKNGWWKHNMGPFVGFWGPKMKPVALLPVGISAYQIVDAEKRSVQIVDEKIDTELSLVGYVFYRPFPDKTPLTFKDLLNYAVEDKSKIFFKIFTFGLVAALLNLFIPFATNILFSYTIPFSDIEMLGQLFAGMLTILITSHLFLFSREWLLVYLDGTVEHNFIMAIWMRLFALPVNFFRRFEVGDLILRAFALEAMRAKLVGPNLRVILNSLFSVLYLFPMLYFSPLLTLVTLLILFPVVVISIFTMIRNYRGSLEIVSLQQKANAHVLQFLTGISKIRNAGAETLSFVLWEKIFTQFKKKQWLLQKLLNQSYVFNFMISQGGNLFIYAALLLAMTFLNYQISLGPFLAFTSALGFFLPAVIDLCNTLLDVNNTFAQWNKAQVLLEEPPEIDSTKVMPPLLTGNIIVDRLKFRYDPEGPLILDDISFYAKPKEFIALVGYSGCGKSTLVRLLIGFEKLEGGAIYYDNKDISTLNLRHLRQQIGTILQTCRIFDGSLRMNVTGGGNYTDKEVEEALGLAGFDEDLKHLPMGLSTVMTSDARSFSGGQIQRILIARALIGKPKIVIFDEATASLDNTIQANIQRNLLNLNATRIIIAHRLSTILQADRIYFLDKGKFTETGTFKELMAKKGDLFNLINKQNFLKSNEILTK